MNTREFIEEVYEIAFGDDAINRDFSYEEVLGQLREFSDKALENDDKYLLQVIQDLYVNVLEDVPDTYYTKHLHCSLADAKEILIEAGVLKDE